MLKKLRLHNFKTFLNAEFSFTQRHLLIGRNNSGKTNLCAAIAFLRTSATADLSTAGLVVPGGVREAKNRSFKGNVVELACLCELPFEGVSFHYVYTLHLSVEASRERAEAGQLVLRVAKESLAIEGPGFPGVTLLESDGHQAQMLHEEDYLRSGTPRFAETLAPADATMLSKLYELETNRRAILFRRYLAGSGYFAPQPEAMRWGWSGRQAGLVGLVPGCNNLAVVLFQMKNADEPRYRRVVQHVQRIVEPDLEAINFALSPDQNALPFIALHSGQGVSWVGLSDGTLRCLALAAIIELVGRAPGGVTQYPSPLVMIEEPENGIFPGQLRAIFDLFEERAPLAQFVFTSHSPYFINLFDGSRESVTLLRRNKEHTEIVAIPPAKDDPDRELLAEQYSMELLD